MDWPFEPGTLIAFATLTFLEIVLGVDNIIFISILSGKLPSERFQSSRAWGLGRPPTKVTVFSTRYSRSQARSSSVATVG